MPDIRKCKWLIGLLTVFVLLSFLYAAPVFEQLSAGIFPGYGAVSEEAETGTAGAPMLGAAAISDRSVMGIEEARLLRPATISAGDSNLPRGTDSISLTKKAEEDIVTREQNQPQTRTLLIRFLAIVFMLVLAVRVTYRILIRRYGCHMIKVWQNIIYIHQVDGKKGERISVYIG